MSRGPLLTFHDLGPLCRCGARRTVEWPTHPPTCITYIPAHLPTCLPAYLPTYLPTYQPTHLPAYLHTCSPTYLPTRLPTHLFPQLTRLWTDASAAAAPASGLLACRSMVNSGRSARMRSPLLMPRVATAPMPLPGTSASPKQEACCGDSNWRGVPGCCGDVRCSCGWPG